MLDGDNNLYEELSGLNNELVNMQRRAVKHNVALEHAQAELERHVQERTLELQQANADMSVHLAEHIRTEEELRQSQEMLQVVMNHIPQGIFWKDRQSRYLGCNLSMAMDAGYRNPADLVGKSGCDMPWAEQTLLHEANDALVMETNTPNLNIEEPLTKADGSRIWLRTNLIPLHDYDANVVGVLGSYEDITEQKVAESSLREAKEEAEQANAAKSEFLSRMSHELRTPMNSILGFAQIMKMDAPGEIQAQRIAHIMTAGQHLLLLIDKLLNLSVADLERRPPNAAWQKEDLDDSEIATFE